MTRHARPGSVLAMVRALARPPVVLLLLSYAACGLALGGDVSLAGLLRAAALVVPFVVGSALVNDLVDERIDRINLAGTEEGRRRLLVSGAGYRRAMSATALGAFVVELGAAAVLGGPARWTLLAVATGGLAVMAAYCLPPVRLSHRGAVASFTLPACYVAMPYLSGLLLARGDIGPGDLPLLLALYVGFVGRILLKDLRDVRGDTMFGKRTVVVRHGRAVTCAVSAALWLVGAGLLLLTTPHPSAVYRLQVAAAALAAVLLLRALAREASPRRQERLVSALAITGRAVVVAVLVTLSAPVVGLATWKADLLLVGFSALLARQAVAMLRYGPAAPLALTANRARSGDFTARARR